MISLCGFAASVVLIAGCSDEGSTDPVSSPTSARQNRPSGIVEGTTFTSPALGYSVKFPDGWSLDEAIIITPSLSTDVFLSPNEDGGVKTNVSVTCQNSAEDEASFLASKRAFAEQFQQNGVSERETSMGGLPAIELVYEQLAGTTLVHKIETHAFGHGCGWTVTLTEGAGADYADLYSTMLRSIAFVAQ
jgi:hypothetical protein